MIVITNAHHFGGFVMNDDLRGVYWNVGDNEYNVQISYPSAKKQYVLEKFNDWRNVGEGKDMKYDKTINIFRKKFKNHSDLEIFITDLSKNSIILMKEV